MKIYFVAANKSSIEIEVIREIKPARLLCSYHYFKNKPLRLFFEEIGYRPEVMLDSGAYSAFTKGKPINLEDYISYIKENENELASYISLDILGDSPASYEIWQQMRSRGLNPIPVFHYNQDETILQKYIDYGAERIALGGTVPERNKVAVAEWVRLISWLYPAKYHLLGSSAARIIDTCDLDSVDASSWIIGAVVGRPRHIKGNDRSARLKRAAWNMQREINRYEKGQLV